MGESILPRNNNGVFCMPSERRMSVLRENEAALRQYTKVLSALHILSMGFTSVESADTHSKISGNSQVSSL
jgi:hypothetical protein